MRSEIRRIWIGLLFAVLFTVLAFVSGGCAADTYTVCSSGCNYTSIQAAIDAATAGDTVEVYSGTYYENVNVHTQLMLQGMNTGGGKPIADARGNGSAITLNANGITVDSFTAMNASGYPQAGIVIYSNNNSVSNNTASNNNYAGIYIYDSSNNFLMENTVSNNYNGIFLDHSSYNSLTSNNFNSNNEGGMFLYSSGNFLTANTASNNSDLGIYLSSSSNNTLESNTVNSNNGSGILLYASSNNNTLMGNTANSNNCAGICLSYSSNNTITDNTANSNTDYGIYLSYSSNNNTLTENTASNNYYGIRLYNSSNNSLTGNAASNNFRGIPLDSSNNNSLTGNAASNNNYAGFRLHNSRNNILTGNTASNNSDGIYLSYSNNNSLTYNTASNNSNGIYLHYSSNNNTLASNTASNNYNGILLYSSGNNNNLAGNIASNNTRGIYLYDLGNNTLTGNTANSNSNCGILLAYSSDNNTLTGNTASNNLYGIVLDHLNNDNFIYDNYFDNTQNAWDDGNNTWNITKTAGTNIVGGPWLSGNYWSDYMGEDTNGDGLGDTQLPYNASGNIVNGGDWLPLVKAEPSIFDTREGNYPSLSGTFTGTITPSRNLTVGTLYTYYCKGTGGHTKSIELYEDQTLIASGVWSGYAGDWHNISFNETFTLYANETYNYTIKTGSYPQIIHESPYNATGGVITCTEFIDINGKRHEGWIPAIRLEGEGTADRGGGGGVAPGPDKP